MLCNITAIYPVSLSSEHTSAPDVAMQNTTFYPRTQWLWGHVVVQLEGRGFD
jgi:hypothetical protein